MCNRIRLFAAIAGLSLLVTAIAFYPAPAWAEDDADPPPFDMEKDEDGNGIPDELEEAYAAIGAIAEGGVNGEGADGDENDKDQESTEAAVQQAIEDFVDRVPVSSKTRARQKKIDRYHRKLSKAKTEERRQELLGKIEKTQQRMLKSDPVYRTAQQHLQTLADQEQTADLGISGAGRPDSVDDYERQINQVGDVMFRNKPFVSTTNWAWTMKWEHIGMYADEGQVYDSDTGQNPCQGVALRRIDTFIEQDTEIQLAQLRNSRGRQYERLALGYMQRDYGTQCQTGYNFNFLDKNNTDAMYCSQLVWATYRRIPYDFDVDVDSNHWRYRLWFTFMYFPLASTRAIPSIAVAPDEIALDRDIHNYYRTTIHIASTPE